MRRRDFLKKGTVAVGLASSPKLVPPLMASESSPQKVSQISGPSADYLRRVQRDEFLPRPPAFAESSRPAGVQISPMPLAERIKRKIVPRRGFCSIAPGATLSEGLTSGNGAMNIEMTCDPYSEQILFHHESLMMPYKRPFEAPKVADIFPQVRQMVLDGKYREAVEFAFQKMEEGPIKRNTYPHPTIPAFSMRLDFPKTASVKDYLRTVDFECSEVKVHWSDERGEWLRQTFTSRPDNVVVQLFTAPKGQSLNVRIAMQRSMGMRIGGTGGTSEFQEDCN